MRIVIALLVILGCLAGDPVRAHELIIGFSPYQDSAKAEVQVKTVLQFLTDTLEPSQSALLVDAYNLQSLGTFAVPPNPAYRHPKAKIMANKQVVTALLAFARAARAPKGGSEPAMMGAIRLPQALAFIGQNYPHKEKAQVVLLGSPIYDDPAERAFSMNQGRIPGDGHFAHGRADTPYGIKGQEALLAQRNIHLAFGDDSWRRDDHHGHYVQRFWTLYIEGQGGKLVTFTGDLPTLWQRVRVHTPPLAHSYTVEHSDKLEMLILKSRDVKEKDSIYDRPVTQTAFPMERLNGASNIEIGVSWDCPACDIDLFTQHHNSETPLSYLNKETPSGLYYKDWRQSPRTVNGLETVAYRVPVDLNNLLIAVNFYGGSAANGVQGELRISLDGQTYARAFYVSAKNGNHGQGREETLKTKQATNANWLVIDPLEVLGVRSAQNIISRR